MTRGMLPELDIWTINSDWYQRCLEKRVVDLGALVRGELTTVYVDQGERSLPDIRFAASELSIVSIERNVAGYNVNVPFFVRAFMNVEPETGLVDIRSWCFGSDGMLLYELHEMNGYLYNGPRGDVEGLNNLYHSESYQDNRTGLRPDGDRTLVGV